MGRQYSMHHTVVPTAVNFRLPLPIRPSTYTATKTEAGSRSKLTQALGPIKFPNRMECHAPRLNN